MDLLIKPAIKTAKSDYLTTTWGDRSAMLAIAKHSPTLAMEQPWDFNLAPAWTKSVPWVAIEFSDLRFVNIVVIGLHSMNWHQDRRLIGFSGRWNRHSLTWFELSLDSCWYIFCYQTRRAHQFSSFYSFLAPMFFKFSTDLEAFPFFQ